MSGPSGIDHEGEIFVGRGVESGLLEAELQRVRAGVSRVVLIEGTPGIGKSALVRRFCAGVRDVRTWRASGDVAESHLSYAAIDQLASGLGGDRTLGHLVGSRRDPFEVGAELVNVLRADIELLVLVIEDAHWADTSSLQALTYALRRLDSVGADSVLTMLVTREGAHSLPEGLQRLVEERGRSLRLSGLSPSELAELADRLGFEDLPPGALERLVQHTDGNPAHLRALMEEVDQEALGRPGEELPAPRSVARDVLDRLAACTSETRNLVQAASVLGERSPLEVACRLAGLAEPIPALEEATAAKLLHVLPTTVGRDVAFPDPLVRAAVYHDLSPGRRSQLHEDAAGLLDDPAALEHRAAAALTADWALAAELARRARAEADQRLLSAAAGHLVSAARLTDDPSGRDRFLLEAAGYLVLDGEVDQAQTLYGQLANGSDSDGARLCCARGQLALLRGKHRQGEQLLTRAWELAAASGEPDVRTAAGRQLAMLRVTQMRPSGAAEWAQRAMDDCPGSADGSGALAIRVVALALCGRPDDALTLVASLPEGGGELTAWDVGGLAGRGMVRLWLGDLPEARADLAAVVEAGLSSPASCPSLVGRACLAWADYRLGNWGSPTDADLAAATAGEAGHAWFSSLLHAMASLVPAARGDWVRAEAQVKAAWQGARGLEHALNTSLAAAAEAHLAFCRGDDARVVEALEPLLQHDCLEAIEVANVLGWRERLVEALVRLERREEAEFGLVALEGVASTSQRPLALASAAGLRGILEAARGRTDAAREAFEAATTHLENQPVPFERALVDHAYGRFLRRAEERSSAAPHLRAAVKTFAGLGARPFLSSAERELRACGVSIRAREDAPPANLTPQEFAVAELVVAGHTNKEVATKLFVSVKTVEFHLANIFSKLGVRSRGQLRRAGPGGSPGDVAG